MDRYCVFDLDGTLISRDTFRWFLLVPLFQIPGKWKCLPALVWRYLQFRLGRCSNHQLKEYFLKRLMAGESREALMLLGEGYVKSLVDGGLIRSKAVAELHSRKSQGFQIILATASPDIYVVALARELGFDLAVCTRLKWGDGDLFTGDIEGLNCYGEEKLRRVEAAISTGMGAESLTVVAYSDHHADIPLLEFATEAHAVSPTRKLGQWARSKNITIVDWN